MQHPPDYKHIRGFSHDELSAFLSENAVSLLEEEALAVLDNPFVTSRMCQTIAHARHLAAFYTVRLRLVQCRATPLADSVKLVHYLHWPDLLRLSVDVKVPAQVRRAIETRLLVHVDTLSLGEKIAAAKRCSATLIRIFLFDPDAKVFAALLINQRLREEDLLVLAGSTSTSAEKLQLLASDRKWSFRYAIRRALAMNPSTPRSTAASQLRFLSRRDLRILHEHPDTSTYLRRCVERLVPPVFTRATERID
jgi:hypothetical protein